MLYIFWFISILNFALINAFETDYIDILAAGPVRPSLIARIATKLSGVLSPQNGLNCGLCRSGLKELQKLQKKHPRLVNKVLKLACKTKTTGICQYLDNTCPFRLTHSFSFLPDFMNAVSLMDMSTDDPDYFCHYILGAECPLPDIPDIDFSCMWPPEPKLQTFERTGETFQVAHVSDIHLSLGYTEGSAANCVGYMCCVPNSFQSCQEDFLPAPKFGHYNCDTPQALLESSLNNVVNTTIYDFVIFTGDSVDHDPAFISRERTFQEETEVMKALKSHLGDVPVYSTFGNHDSYPYSQEAAAWTGFAQKFSYNTELMRDLWVSNEWIDEEASRDVSLHHGAFAVMAKPRLKIISLNSNFWYRFNFYNYARTSDPDASGMLGFLIQELVRCEEQGQKAWIIAHVPPGGLDNDALPVVSEALRAIFQRFTKTIAGLFFGHTHKDEFTILYAGNGSVKNLNTALNVALIAPSITPLKNYNPGWRYYEVDSGSFEIMDVIGYYGPVDPYFGIPWRQVDEMEWKWEYSARDTYNEFFDWPDDMPLNAQFWHMISERIVHDPIIAQKFLDLSYRFSPMTPICNATCRIEQFCYTTSMSVIQAKECRKTLLGDIEGSFANSTRVPQFPMPRPVR